MKVDCWSILGFRVFFFQAEDGIRDKLVTGVQTCALPIFGFVVYTSDRGMAGALNSNTLRRATEEILARPAEPQLVTIGRKGQDRSEERRVGKEWRRWGGRWK